MCHQRKKTVIYRLFFFSVHLCELFVRKNRMSVLRCDTSYDSTNYSIFIDDFQGIRVPFALKKSLKSKNMRSKIVEISTVSGLAYIDSILSASR